MLARAMLVAALIAATPVIAGDAGRTYVVVERPGVRSPLPFSEGVRVGDTLYVAGHLGLDPATGQAPASTEIEARAVMDAIQRTVEQGGLKMDDLVTVTVCCTDLALYDTFNAVYRTYFHGKFPARAFIGTATLLRGARFEVMGVAVQSAK